MVRTPQTGNFGKDSKMGRLISLITIGAFLLAAAPEVTAADWERSADLGLALTQSTYNSHWTGGEAGSVNWIANANAAFSAQFRPKLTWANTIKLAFGQTHIQDQESKEWAKPEKSADRVFFESVWRFKLWQALNPYAAATFESQFLDASVPQVKRYVNPFTLTEAIGLTRVFADTTYLKFVSRLGFALRQYTDNVVVDTIAATKERRSTTSGGLEWVTDFSHTFADEKMKYDTKLRTFVAFFRSGDEFSEDDDDWQAPHVAWEHTFSAAISKVVQVQLFVEFLYDKEISEAVRFKETLALGLTYRMF
jgi:hypothetical protein